MEATDPLNPSYGPVNPHLSAIMETSPATPHFFVKNLHDLISIVRQNFQNIN